MLIVSGILFTFIGLYLDKVLPKEYGNSEPWYFVCSPRFWGCTRREAVVVNREEEGHDLRDTLLDDDFEAKNLKPEYYEPVAADVAKLELDAKCLKVDNLRKTYQNGFKAVKGINVKMFQG